jgi:hypothetical protein
VCSVVAFGIIAGLLYRRHKKRNEISELDSDYEPETDIGFVRSRPRFPAAGRANINSVMTVAPGTSYTNSIIDVRPVSWADSEMGEHSLPKEVGGLERSRKNVSSWFSWGGDKSIRASGLVSALGSGQGSKNDSPVDRLVVPKNGRPWSDVASSVDSPAPAMSPMPVKQTVKFADESIGHDYPLSYYQSSAQR